MSRGGRRRKSRRRSLSPAKSQSAPAPDATSKKDRAGPQSDSASGGSVVEQMRTHTRRLQTFPPDEVQLDDLIAGLQSEFGIPPTPQEYRLVIRTPSAEPEVAADTITPVAQETQETSDATPPGGTPISTTGRRRRRRRSTSASGLTHDATDGEPDQSEDAGGGSDS